MIGSTTRRFLLAPALTVALLVALAPAAGAKVDPAPPSTTAEEAPTTTVAESAPSTTTPPSTTVPTDPPVELEAAKVDEPVVTTAPSPAFFVGPIGPISAVGPGVPIEEPEPQPNPQITVTPNVGVQHLQTVQVSGTGFTPNHQVGSALCRAGVTGVEDCDISRTIITSTDSAGAWTGSLVVSARIRVSGQVVDCTEPGACVVGAARIYDYAELTSAPIEFDPSTVPTPPVVTVDPSTDLVHDQQVTVSGSGFAANDNVQIIQCSVGGDPYPVCAYSSLPGAPTDGDGNLSTSFTVRRIIGYGPDFVVDCAEAPGCVLQTQSYFDPLAATQTPIGFDPDAPLPPPPVLTVDPDEDLVHNEPVAVSGSGFAPNQFLDLSECAEKDGVTVACRYFGGRGIQTDATGAFETTIAIRRVLANYAGEPRTDCLDADECALYARTYDDPLGFAEAELHFDPDAPLPPPPSLTVDPSSDLPARQLVEVDGEGFTPDVWHNVVQCTSDSTFFDFRCIFGPSVLADENGDIHAEATLRRYISSGPEPIDCAESDRCIVAVFSYEDGLSFAFAPVSFDPDAPPPPKPSVAVSSSTGLSDGQTITLSGSGFTPLASVGFGQCHNGADGPEDCEPSTTRYANADAEGSFTAEFVVKAQIQRPVGGTLDCTTGAGVCILGVANIADWSESPDQTPLAFGDGLAAQTLGVGGGGPGSSSLGPLVAGAPLVQPAPLSVSSPQALAFTGTPVAGYLEFAAITLGLGTLLVLASRRRRTAS